VKSVLRSGMALVTAAVLGAGIFAATNTIASPGSTAGSVAIAGQGNNGNGNGKGLGGQPTTADAVYLDGIKDYGVCRGVDPACYNDWGQGWTEGETKRILIYSRTVGPRHAHLGTALAPGLNPPLNPNNVAQAALKAWAEERGIQVDYTEDVSRMTSLNNYQAVVFLSPTRDTLDDNAQTALMQFVRRGGGFVGIHNAFGTEYHWPWYEGLLGGANFYDHAPNRAGTIETINDDDVSTAGFPATWDFRDEFYNLVPYPSYVNVLLEVDEATSLNGRATGHPGHGAEHPVSWCHYYDGGKAFLTTLGHDVQLWTGDPNGEIANEELFKQHIVNGLESVMGIQPFCQA